MNCSQIHQTVRQDWREACHLTRELFHTARRIVLRVHRLWKKVEPVIRRVPGLVWVLAVCCGLGGCLGQEKAARRFGSQKKTVSAPAVGAAASASSTSGGKFSLTFDDGPHPVHTPALLDWLKKHHIRATFFVLGENAERYPHVVKRMAAEGHEVANHSWSHPNLRLMSTTRMLQQVRRTHDLIQKLTGRAPVAFRPPYGSLSAAQRKLIEKEFGYQVVLWSVDTLDWKHRTAAPVADILRTEVKDHSIVLAHDIHGRILPALERMLPQWRRAGLKPVLLGEMVPFEPPTRLITSR